MHRVVGTAIEVLVLSTVAASILSVQSSGNSILAQLTADSSGAWLPLLSQIVPNRLESAREVIMPAEAETGPGPGGCLLARRHSSPGAALSAQSFDLLGVLTATPPKAESRESTSS